MFSSEALKFPNYSEPSPSDKGARKKVSLSSVYNKEMRGHASVSPVARANLKIVSKPASARGYGKYTEGVDDTDVGQKAYAKIRARPTEHCDR